MKLYLQKNSSFLGLLFFLVFTLFYPEIGFCKKFANQFTEFELPPQWNCTLEGAEWVCQNTNDVKKKDAIIVLAAKLKGDHDTLDQYYSYLTGPKTYTSIQGRSVKSDPKYTKNVNINGQGWVDSLHLESEIPGFYTRYLATIKQDIGILVTYSISKSKYQQYLDEFENMTKTLKVFRKSGGLNAAPQASNLFQNVQIPTNVGSDTIFPGGQIQGGAEQSTASNKPIDKFPLSLILGVVAVIGFIIWRRKKNSMD